MGSDFKAGQAELDALKRRYGKEPWFSRLDGQYTGELVRGEVDRARWESPHVSWFYDSEAVLRGLKIPQLWVFAQDDSVAPSANSIARLEKLRSEGVDATIVVYPHTDHGITTFVTEAPGKRRTTGLARGYLRLIADWAKGGLKPPYGDAAWLATGRTPGS
jgi:acetyl esterase/lipase